VTRRSCSRITSPSRKSLLSWVWIEEDKVKVARARKIERFLSQPFQVAEVFTNNPDKLFPISETISRFQEILAGKYYHLPEGSFYMMSWQH